MLNAPRIQNISDFWPLICKRLLKQDIKIYNNLIF